MIKSLSETLPHHYRKGNRVCKLWDAGDQYGLDLQEATETVYFDKADTWQVLKTINGFLHAGPLAHGSYFPMVINQGYREIDVEKIYKTRARIRYLMPNAGEMSGWLPIIKTPAGKVYAKLEPEQVDRGY